MNVSLRNARIVTPLEVIEDGAIVSGEDGRIVYVGPAAYAPPTAWLDVDLRGRWVVPGLIDIHVHGGHGIVFGFSDDLARDLRDYSAWVACGGETGFLLSVYRQTADELLDTVQQYAAALDQPAPGAVPLGLHLEGPFMNVERKGAFDPAWLRPVSIAEVDRLLDAGRGWVRQVSLAPELPGAAEVAAHLRERGVVAAIAHTNADYATTTAALRGPFNHVTHTYNAMSPLHQREPGVVGAVLASDRVTAEVIGDGLHVHPAAVKALLRCVGVERLVIITDAVPAAGLVDGVYQIAGQTLIVERGVGKLADGTLAGSVATMNVCVRSMVHQVGASLPDAVKMATLNPAQVIGWETEVGSLSVGRQANWAVVDDDLNVDLTVVRGRVVYSR